MNERISKKERGLLKGAIRRVFSRSELRRTALAAAKVNHTDSTRTRVKTWYQCPQCSEYCAGHEMQVDHILPIIGLEETLESLSWETLVNRVWCDANNLVAICKTCHTNKTKAENKERRQFKKRKAKNE